MADNTIDGLDLLKAIINQALRDMQRDEEVDGFPSGKMAALDFFHSDVFESLCQGLFVQPVTMLELMGIPDKHNCQCYQCRTDYTLEATAVAKYDCGGNYWFAHNTKHIVVWQDDLIVEVYPTEGEPNSWLTAREYLGDKVWQTQHSRKQ